jgi:hypothetical protein
VPRWYRTSPTLNELRDSVNKTRRHSNCPYDNKKKITASHLRRDQTQRFAEDVV